MGQNHRSAKYEERLHEVLLSYLEADAHGLAPDMHLFLDRHPEFAEELADFFTSRQQVERIIAPLISTAGPSASFAEVSEFRDRFGDLSSQSQLGSALPLFPPGQSQQTVSTCPLGDFQLFREIGRGGMGIVFEAEQLSLGRRVAVKVLPFAAGLDSKQLQRFKNEAQTAALLNHPNIVPVYAIGCEQGVHYFAMQFIQGQSLATLIREQAEHRGIKSSPPDRSCSLNGRSLDEVRSPALWPLSRSQAVRRHMEAAELGMRAARALEYAHQNGVIHRDIKPANLLLDERGELWITDFGLATFRSNASVTMTGELIGTLRYMSPEQALAKRSLIDHRTDIYSLGATLYELLILRPVFAGLDGHELLYQIAHQEPWLPRSVDGSIPIDLETILLKAMAKNPSDRYSSAQELADDLQRFQEGKPIQARRPTLLDRTGKWARRHKAVVAAALSSLLIVILVLIVSNFVIAREHRETKAAFFREQLKVQEAERQRALAEMNFRQARQAVDFFVELSDEEMHDRSQLFETRLKMLETALTFYQDFIEQHNDDPSIQAELSDSLARTERILQELPMMQKCRHFTLLCSVSVQDDLGLSEHQRFCVAERREKIIGRWKDESNRLRRSESLNRRPLSVERSKWCEQAVVDILTPAQRLRLQQIAYQQMGIRALNHVEVIKELGLTPTQRQDLVHRLELERIRKEEELWKETPLTVSLGELYTKILENRRRSLDRALTVLTVEQKERWKVLTGKPFQGNARLLLSGSRRLPF
jgi:serine/threonine protein kinase